MFTIKKQVICRKGMQIKHKIVVVVFLFTKVIIVFSLQVPIRQTIYTPAKTMHSRNYLRYSVFDFKII